MPLLCEPLRPALRERRNHWGAGCQGCWSPAPSWLPDTWSLDLSPDGEQTYHEEGNIILLHLHLQPLDLLGQSLRVPRELPHLLLGQELLLPRLLGHGVQDGLLLHPQELTKLIKLLADSPFQPGSLHLQCRGGAPEGECGWNPRSPSS